MSHEKFKLDKNYGFLMPGIDKQIVAVFNIIPPIKSITVNPI